MLITNDLLKTKAAAIAALAQEEAEAEKAAAIREAYLAEPILCDRCGDRGPDLHYVRHTKCSDGYRLLACSCRDDPTYFAE